MILKIRCIFTKRLLMKDILTQSYGYIFEEALIDEIAKVAVYKKFKADEFLIEIGIISKRCHFY